MLPPRLGKLKQKLEQAARLSDEQRSLLVELRALERDPRLRVEITEELQRNISATRIVSGPGACECCGR